LKRGQSLTDKQMQEIAAEHKGFVSEVVYCAEKGGAEFDLVYYSSEREVPFCGHGTIACMYSLIKNTPALINKPEITIYTRTKGSLVIFNKIPEQNAIFISAPEPVYLDVPVGIEDIAESIGIDTSVISNDRCPVDFIDAGNRTLIVPLKNLDDTVNIFPDEQKQKKFSLKNGIDVVLIFSMDTRDRTHFAHTRVFAAKYGYLEDPATGSGNSAFGYYLLKNKLWSGESISIEQGGCDRVFNMVRLTYHDGRVLFGGSATTSIRGEYLLNEEDPVI